MRLLIMAALSIWTVGYSGVVSAQTVETPATAVEAVGQEATQRQSSWYGEPLAMNGQDVVSFLAEGGPVQGNQTFTAEYDNTQWQFASAENRDIFLSDPDRYVPEFGGYCPVALAKGDLKIGSAEHFNIVDDKLYVNYDKASSDLFGRDTIGYIAAAKLNF